MKKLFLLFSILALAGFVYAHDDYPTRTDHYTNEYQQGYQSGYNHGFRDRRANVGFDFRHAYEYQEAKGEHDSYDTHQSCDFRVGYVEGYADGFFRHNPLFGRFDLDNDNDYDHDRDRDRGEYDDNDYQGGYGGGGSRGAAVTVFTRTGFSGYARDFSPGQYPYLEGRLNDSIESVRINGGFRVILFDDGNFRGPRVVLDRDSWDLGGFRHKAASMIIEPIGYGRQ